MSSNWDSISLRVGNIATFTVDLTMIAIITIGWFLAGTKYTLAALAGGTVLGLARQYFFGPSITGEQSE